MVQYKLVGKTCTGKTTQLLMNAEAEQGIVVCQNPDRMIERAHSRGITGLRIIGYTDEIPTNEPIFVDDLEAFVCAIGYNNLIGYTLSCDD